MLVAQLVGRLPQAKGAFCVSPDNKTAVMHILAGARSIWTNDDTLACVALG